MTTQQLEQGRQDGQTGGQRASSNIKGAMTMATRRRMGRVVTIVVGLVVAAGVALIGSMAGPLGDEVGARTSVLRVPYDAGWDLYDNGWAGGPGPRTEPRSKPAVVRVPYEAGWALYDNGWAGGPKTLP